MPIRACRPLLPLALLLAAARAEAQSLVTDPGTPFVASAPTAFFGTTGALMNGMEVVAHFGDGVLSSGVWGSLGSGLSGVQTSRFLLFHGSSTPTGSSRSWNLANRSTQHALTRLVFHGSPGRTVFDLPLFGGDPIGTPGSSTGQFIDIDPLDLPRSVLAATVATYRNEVAVVGSLPYGDLWETVDLDMGAGLGPQRPMRFNMDTDNLPATATLVPGSSVAPEPATLALVATGLLATGAAARRGRRRRTE